MKIQSWMSKEQKAYIRAAAAQEQVMAEFNAALPPFPETGNQAALDSYAVAHGALAEKYRIVDAINAKLDVRWALLDWAKDVISADPANAADLPALLDTFTHAYHNTDLLDELVKLCMELDPHAQEVA